MLSMASIGNYGVGYPKLKEEDWELQPVFYPTVAVPRNQEAKFQGIQLAKALNAAIDKYKFEDKMFGLTGLLTRNMGNVLQKIAQKDPLFGVAGEKDIRSNPLTMEEIDPLFWIPRLTEKKKQDKPFGFSWTLVGLAASVAIYWAIK